MNVFVIMISFGVSLFVFQVLFVTFCVRWLASGKRKRDKEFQLLDEERQQIIEMQAGLKKEIEDVQRLSKDTFQKLRILSTEVHEEWNDVTNKVSTILEEVESQIGRVCEGNLSKLSMERMAIEKCLQDAQCCRRDLLESLKKVNNVVKLLDSSISADDVVKDIQTDKYLQAKQMLEQGYDASTIASKLALTKSEVVTISNIR